MVLRGVGESLGEIGGSPYTWPDITFTVIRMSPFLANPHGNTRLPCCQYDGKKAKSLQAFTDSDWAPDLIKQ